MSKESNHFQLPIIGISNEILLPGCAIEIQVSGKGSLSMVKKRLLTNPNTLIGIVHLKNVEEKGDMLEPSNLISEIGTSALVVRSTFGGIGKQKSVMLTVEGISRFRIKKLLMEEPYPVALVSEIDQQLEHDYKDLDDLAPVQSEFLKALATAIHFLSLPPTIKHVVFKHGEKKFELHYVDFSASIIQLSYAQKLDLLQTLGLKKRMQKIIPYLKRINNGTAIVNPWSKLDANSSANRPATFILYKGVNKGNPMDDDSEIGELANKLKKANLPPHAEEVANNELKRLSNAGRFSADNGVIKSYLELLTELPWQCSSEEVIDLANAQTVLNSRHYGLQEVKKRVLEFLAVRHLKKDSQGPILCFVGPPGVGKTSIARSIAHALGRKFHQIALGGVCHQSDIRGHRKTYVGAMPGRIIQALKTTGVNNPVILLDEVDKMGREARNGDPASALLEVLDPEQNTNFVDHYVNIPFDLSKVMFIASSNSHSHIPFALYDRMEVITIGSYTSDEKLHIAQEHLLPKVISNNGLNEGLITVPQDSLKMIISLYTNESGVRSLEKRLSALCRSVALKVAKLDTVLTNNDSEPSPSRDLESLTFPIFLDKKAVEDILGPPFYDDDVSWSRLAVPGTAVGLATNSNCGGSITIIECYALPNSRSASLRLTGRLGSVMKESATLAWNWVRINYTKLVHYGPLQSKVKREIEHGTNENAEENRTWSSTLDSEVHIHFPAGAVSKEGPSAGITIATALVSLILNIPVTSHIAMTGELSLKGFVLPVGGIKSKVLAGFDNGIKRIILPKLNQKDLVNLPSDVLSQIDFVFAETMEDVLQAAFNGAVSLTSLEEQAALTSKL